MSLDPIAKEVWCEALRSGEFPQTERSLKNGAGYCCLGVAMEIFPALKKHPICQTLSDGACELLGITEYERDVLAWRNDHGNTFAEIADYIEREL